MDPQQRMLLETTWQSLEDAGIDPDGLRGSRTGVYAGFSGCEYRDLAGAGGSGVDYLGTAGSVAVGRIAFALGLMGPAMPLDMTCASSLAAIHEAAMALQSGEIDLALAGGVKAILSRAVTDFMVEIGMLSLTGQCRTFDASADGHVRGEGCGMLVLKRLAEAQADGDRIWAVIRGSAVNQNGASAGLTVPYGPAQEQVIEAALDRAGIAPAEIDYLEAHGTGSALGDPIEVQAAAAVYGRGREPERPLLMGTVKTGIGHLEAAAGIAGLIKVVLAMRQGEIPKQLHFRTPNPAIDWERLPVRVTGEATAWPHDPDRPARAGISSFGLSGANAHVVVEAYGESNGVAAGNGLPFAPAGEPRPVADTAPETESDPAATNGDQPDRQRLLPLSAKSGDALRDLANRYLGWLDEHADSLSGEGEADQLLSDMAWTACVGRSHFEHRASVVFHDAASLREGLRAVAAADGKREPAVADGGSVEEAAAAAYEAGDPVSLAGLFAGEERRRVALPGYPFQRRRFWIGG